MENKEEQPVEVIEETTQSGFSHLLSEPLSKRGWPVWLVYLLSALGLLYLLNPTAGLIEFLPDNLPLIGNLDEGVAVLLVLAGLVEFFEGRKKL